MSTNRSPRVVQMHVDRGERTAPARRAGSHVAAHAIWWTVLVAVAILVVALVSLLPATS